MGASNPNGIDVVLENRKKSIEMVEGVIKYLHTIIVELDKLKLIKKSLLKFDHLDDKSKSTLSEITSKLPLMESAVDEEIEIWKNLHHRFSRDKINIGVIGRQRQGKSTFLQNLTNLEDNVIPAREGLPCTSVQSIIYHTEDAQHAEISYYNESEFIKYVIDPYLKKLRDDYKFSKTKINSIDDFKQLALTSPTDQQSYKSVATGWYNSFFDIWKNIKDYEEDIKKGDKISIGLEEIKDYVQYKYKGKEISSYNYVGIKKVIINCKFDNPNVHKLGVIDLPGLGSTRLGDEERLIRALGEDVDFVLFVKYPSSVNSDWEDKDSELYQTANTILSERLPFRSWSFVLLNRDSSNGKMCKELEETIMLKPEIDFAKIIEVDVSKREDANQVLSQAIEYLKNNIHRLDKFLIDKCLGNLDYLKGELLNVLKKAKSIVFANNVETKFDLKFEEFYTDLVNDIVNYRKKLVVKEELDDEWFRGEIDKIIQQTKDSISFPSKIEFERISNKELTQYKLYHVLVHHVRSIILRNFHDFTNKQQTKIDKQKEEITSILRSSNLLGRLDGTSELDNLSFLNFLREKIEADERFQYFGILEGFDFLCRFKVSYESSIQELVYSNIIQFFSDKIQELNSMPDLQEFYEKTGQLRKVKLTKKNESGKEEEKFEKAKSLAFVRNNTEDLAQICISVIGLFPGAELITNVYDICKSILNILNSEKDLAEKGFETEVQIQKLENVVYNSNSQQVKEIKHESLENLKKTVHYVLDMCKEELTYTIGQSTQRILTSMSKEFFDHLVYTKDSEFEWKEFVRTIRAEIWKDFDKESKLRQELENWNIVTNNLGSLLQKAS